MFWSHLGGAFLATIVAMTLYSIGSAYFIFSGFIAFSIVITYSLRVFLDFFQFSKPAARIAISIGISSLIFSFIITRSRVDENYFDVFLWGVIYTIVFFMPQLIFINMGRLISEKFVRF